LVLSNGGCGAGEARVSVGAFHVGVVSMTGFDDREWFDRLDELWDGVVNLLGGTEMASRRCIMMADAYLSGWQNGKGHQAGKDEASRLAKYLTRAGYPVTFVEAENIIVDYCKRGTLLV
jgi:hypothetical protein